MIINATGLQPRAYGPHQPRRRHETTDRLAFAAHMLEDVRPNLFWWLQNASWTLRADMTARQGLGKTTRNSYGPPSRAPPRTWATSRKRRETVRDIQAG